MRNTISVKVRILNIIGATGYIVTLLQWFWTVIIFIPSIIQSPLFVQFFSPVKESPLPVATSSPTAVSVSPVMALLGTILGIVIAGVLIYIMASKVPRTIAKAGETMTHKPAELLVPIVIKHSPKLSKQEKRALPTTFILIVKMLLVVAPFCLLAFASRLNLDVTFEIVVVVGVMLFSWSFFLFALQFFLARFLHVEYRDLR